MQSDTQDGQGNLVSSLMDALARRFYDEERVAARARHAQDGGCEHSPSALLNGHSEEAAASALPCGLSDTNSEA